MKIKIKQTPEELPEMKKGGLTNKSVPYYNPHVYYNNSNWYDVIAPTTPDINGTIGPVDEDVANIEAEKGEIIMKPNLTGMHKITGKKHSQGGTPLYADPGSFIFSDDPDLAISKKDKELFDLKEHKSKAKRENTPAKVLNREVKPKDYNMHLNVLTDEKSDDIAKKTAILMLEKMQNKIGQIAYLQETKKKQPVPDFAMGTAPVADAHYEDIEEKQAQYAIGGFVDPFADLPEDPTGKWGGDRKKTKNPRTGAYSNNWNAMTGFGSPQEYANAVGFKGNPRDIKALQQFVMQEYPEIVNQFHQDPTRGGYGQPLAGRPDDGKLGKRWDAIGQAIQNLRDPQPSNIPFNRTQQPAPNVNPPAPGYAPAPERADTTPTLHYDVKGKLTDAQLANLAYLGLNAMNVKKYMPKREQVDLPNVRLDRISAQPMLNNINNQAYATRELLSLNPRNAAINAGNVYGKSLDQANQVLGNVANQNVQIGNQENLTNLQQETQQVMYNNNQDSKYYDEVQTANENYDREKRFANNQVMSTLNTYQSQDDALAWSLASVNKYGRRPVYDKTGKIVAYKPVPLYEQTSTGIKYNADVADLAMASGADRTNSVQEIKTIMNQFGLNTSDPKQLYAFARFYESITGKGKNPVYQNNPYIKD